MISTDVSLSEPGYQFDGLAAQLDQAIANGSDIAQDTLNQLSNIEAKIIATPATTVVGLRVKARAAGWALLGDLDAAGELTTDKRMALSIVRDLIHLYDPRLERPGALKRLLKENE